ncbi:MAG: alanine racemase [Ruminococcaceae bacterium]|nr:alanine racemase [Oscillospiraceae bacterium]
MTGHFSAHRAIATVDTAAIQHNFSLLRQHASKNGRAPRLIAVVKANAYGHGTALAVPALTAAGCDFFAVATLEEALNVHLLAPKADILILGYTPPSKAALLAEARITQTVFSPEYAIALSKSAKNRPVSVHIKIDCGMHRLGFAPDALEEVATVAALPGLCATGLYTHFPAADTDLAATRCAFSRFLRCREQLEAKGLRFFCHTAASAALLALPETVLDAARPGLALYGIPPVSTPLPLRPAMALLAPIVQIHEVPAGVPVGYGGAFVTKGQSRIGVCPIGYADGYPRGAENVPITLLHQNQTFSIPVAGHICMDQTMVDLSETPAEVGDHILFWQDPRPLARHLHTIPYEILTAVSCRVERKKKGAPL